ncbi:MAG TPA: serine protease, partial [Alphaproteobacteria bacterium]|nr:serine protease [Alphaproteobacteria bacterium]
TAEGGKKLQRPWVGLTPKVVTNDVAESLGLDRPQGVLVQSLAANGPAARAGLREGDVVTKVDGQEVADPEALRYRLATKGVGSTAQLSYLRDGSSGVATVALTKAPDSPPRNIQDIDGPNPLNGAVVGNLNPAFAEELGVEAQQGVVIVDVNRRSLAARVGLRPEDIVVRINGRRIDSVDVLLEQVRQRPRGWELVVDRKGRELSVRLPPVR